MKIGISNSSLGYSIQNLKISKDRGILPPEILQSLAGSEGFSHETQTNREFANTFDQMQKGLSK